MTIGAVAGMAGLFARNISATMRGASTEFLEAMSSPGLGIPEGYSTAQMAVSRVTLPAAEQLFLQALGQGPETLAGFTIHGNKAMQGRTFVRNILLLDGPKTLTSPRALLNAVETEALGAGADRVVITGHAIINEGLFNSGSRLLQKLGWTFSKINSETVMISKNLR